MATVHLRAVPGPGINSTSGTAYQLYGTDGNGWTLPSNIVNTCTVNILIRDSTFGNSGYLTANVYGANTSDYYLCDSSGGSAVKIQSFSSAAITNTNTSWTQTSNNNPVSVNLSGLKGKALYLKEVKTVGGTNGGVHMRGDCALTLTYTITGNPTPPTTVTVARNRTKCTISWSGAQNGTNNNITGYTVIRNTSVSTSGAATIGTTSGSSITDYPGINKTVYYAVRSNGASSNSDYRWSPTVTIPPKPSVAMSTTITDTQMDKLREWIGTSGITDIADEDIVDADAGNTYKNNLTASTSAVTATWYNNTVEG